MENMQNQYGAVQQHSTGTDAYGNPLPARDEFGNPINYPAASGTGAHEKKEHHGLGEMLHRSGSSSSSSSSEDDGQGGRRKKKGLKEKIKEKMPGQHKKQQQLPDHSTSTTTPGAATDHKGIIDKIKDKLPGHHQHHEHP